MKIHFIQSALLLALTAAATGCLVDAEDGSHEDDELVDETDDALAATGQDFPGDDCVRINKDGTSTYGKCENVCKDKTVYNPSPSEDPAGTDGRCYEKKKIALPGGFTPPAGPTAFAP